MPLKKARLKISDYNDKRKSRLKNQERRIRSVSLSLTSMVDMFAILVIFLLSNSTSVTQWLELGHQIDLPKARASDPPPRGATFQISRDGVFDETKKLATIASILQGNTAIKGYLARVPKKGKTAYVNIVADHRVPYGVIRRVISACQESGFGNVNLAVQPKGKSG